MGEGKARGAAVARGREVFARLRNERWQSDRSLGRTATPAAQSVCDCASSAGSFADEARTRAHLEVGQAGGMLDLLSADRRGARATGDALGADWADLRERRPSVLSSTSGQKIGEPGEAGLAREEGGRLTLISPSTSISKLLNGSETSLPSLANGSQASLLASALRPACVSRSTATAALAFSEVLGSVSALCEEVVDVVRRLEERDLNDLPAVLPIDEISPCIDGQASEIGAGPAALRSLATSLGPLCRTVVPRAHALLYAAEEEARRADAAEEVVDALRDELGRTIRKLELYRAQLAAVQDAEAAARAAEVEARSELARLRENARQPSECCCSATTSNVVQGGGDSGGGADAKRWALERADLEAALARAKAEHTRQLEERGREKEELRLGLTGALSLLASEKEAAERRARLAEAALTEVVSEGAGAIDNARFTPALSGTPLVVGPRTAASKALSLKRWSSFLGEEEAAEAEALVLQRLDGSTVAEAPGMHLASFAESAPASVPADRKPLASAPKTNAAMPPHTGPIPCTDPTLPADNGNGCDAPLIATTPGAATSRLAAPPMCEWPSHQLFTPSPGDSPALETSSPGDGSTRPLSPISPLPARIGSPAAKVSKALAPSPLNPKPLTTGAPVAVEVDDDARTADASRGPSMLEEEALVSDSPGASSSLDVASPTSKPPRTPPRAIASPTQVGSTPVIGFPDKFHFAQRYAEALVMPRGGSSLEDEPFAPLAPPNDEERLLLYALSQQAEAGPLHTSGSPTPSMWNTVERAKWRAWRELGSMSRVEAMYKYATAVETLAPMWWRWPPLGLADDAHPAPVEEGVMSIDNSNALAGPDAEPRLTARASSAAVDHNDSLSMNGHISASISALVVHDDGTTDGEGGIAASAYQGPVAATGEAVAVDGRARDHEGVRALEDLPSDHAPLPSLAAGSVAASDAANVGFAVNEVLRDDADVADLTWQIAAIMAQHAEDCKRMLPSQAAAFAKQALERLQAAELRASRNGQQIGAARPGMGRAGDNAAPGTSPAHSPFGDVPLTAGRRRLAPTPIAEGIGAPVRAV